MLNIKLNLLHSILNGSAHPNYFLLIWQLSIAQPFLFNLLIHLKLMLYMKSKKENVASNAENTKLSYGPLEKKMAKGENLFHDLFINALKDIYWAEKYLLKALPKVAKSATTTELRETINDHLLETEEQEKKLVRVFELIGEKPQGKKCEAMEGLVMEANEIINETDAGSYSRDAALIMTAQKIEHYQIASYGSLKEFAKTMGHHDAVLILNEILEEEKKADQELNEIAISRINEQARTEWLS